MHMYMNVTGFYFFHKKLKCSVTCVTHICYVCDACEIDTERDCLKAILPVNSYTKTVFLMQLVIRAMNAI